MLSLLRYNVPPSVATPTSSAPPPTPSRHTRRRRLRARCAPADPGGESSSLNELVSEKVDLLLRREENRHLLDGLEEASRRVDDARRALADIERQEGEAARAKEEAILELRWREAQIAESQKEVLEAKAMVEEAEHSLSSSFSQTSSGEDAIGGEVADSDMERLESVKAAAVSSIVGVFAALPISLYQTSSSPQLFQHLTVVFISSALFGVTFRYAIRRDVDNIQLKTGTSAAFGFVQGLAALEAAKPLEFSTASFISDVFDGTVYVSTSVLVFLFSAVALDFCFKAGLLSPFPMRK